jgi:hypothetical protein
MHDLASSAPSLGVLHAAAMMSSISFFVRQLPTWVRPDSEP